MLLKLKKDKSPATGFIFTDAQKASREHVFGKHLDTKKPSGYTPIAKKLILGKSRSQSDDNRGVTPYGHET
jgi:hypothetical protein